MIWHDSLSDCLKMLQGLNVHDVPGSAPHRKGPTLKLHVN